MRTLFILSLVCAANACLGQGEVYFNNSSISKVSTNSYPGGPPTGLTTTNANAYYYALFVAPATVSTVNGVVFNDSNWTFTGDYATNTVAVAGHFYGGTNPDQSTSVPGYAAGTSASFIVIGWSANIGSNVAALEAWYNFPLSTGWFGQSDVSANRTLGGGLYPAPAIFASSGSTPTLGEIGGFTFGFVYAVPEPSTLTLFGLSTCALIAHWRRQK